MRVPDGHLACPHGVGCSPAPVRGAAANSEDLNLISSPTVAAAYAAYWYNRLAVSVRFDRRED
jgi:hypothetical protein